MPGLRCARPGRRVGQLGQVSRLILLGIGETERADADRSGSARTGSVSQEAVVGSNVPFGINSVSSSANAGEPSPISERIWSRPTHLEICSV
jgi:hypothetical protein